MILLRYLSREVLTTMFAVAGIVLVISMGWRFSGYLENAAAGLMAREALFALMAYRLPGFLELIIPVSFFLSIMLVHGRLHTDSEMIVLQACGMSTARLIQMTLIMALAVMCITAGISLWLKPLGESQVEKLLSDQNKLTEFDTLVPGRFQTLSSGNRVTYTEEITRKGELANVFINEYREPARPTEPRKTVTVIADTGVTQVDSNHRRFLVLNNGTRYEGTPGEKNYQVITYEEYGQLVDSGVASRSKRRQAAIPTSELFSSSDPQAVSELNWRISVVLMIPIIAMMAIPLAKVNPRQGKFTRLVPAMILCFVYIVALSAGRTALAKGDIPLGFGLWWIHGSALVVTWLAYQLDWLIDKVSRLPGLAYSR